MDPVILTVFIIYMGIVLAIGFAAARRARGAEGFFLADRGLGAWVVGISAAASSESSWLLMGCVGMGFTEGVAALWIAVGCLAGFCLNWFAVAERLRRRTGELGAVTVPDFIEAQVGDTSGAIRAVAVLIILLLMFTYVAAQLTGMGKAFDAMLGIPYQWGVILGAAITIIYTTAGGFRAVSWTDVLQGAMMAVALTLLPMFLIGLMGGPGPFWERLAAQEAETVLTSITGGRASLAFLGFLIGMLGIGLGYPGTPHVITRFMAARGPREIAQGRVIAITWGVVSLFGAIFLGMAVRCLIPDLADPEHGILAAAERYLSPVLAALVLAAVVSAARSTVDSQLLVATSAVAHDAYRKLFRRDLADRRMLILCRAVVIALGLAAIGLALTETRVVFWFVLFSWAGLGASFGPVILLSLYWRGLTRWGALTGIVTGFGVVLLWKLYLRKLLEQSVGVDVYELVPAFFIAAAVAVVVSLLTRDRGDSG